MATREELKSGIICVECGENTPFSEARGSYRHPYCKKCFVAVWKNDYDKYFEWLNTEHI